MLITKFTSPNKIDFDYQPTCEHEQSCECAKLRSVARQRCLSSETWCCDWSFYTFKFEERACAYPQRKKKAQKRRLHTPPSPQSAPPPPQKGWDELQTYCEQRCRILRPSHCPADGQASHNASRDSVQTKFQFHPVIIADWIIGIKDHRKSPWLSQKHHWHVYAFGGVNAVTLSQNEWDMAAECSGNRQVQLGLQRQDIQGAGQPTYCWSHAPGPIGSCNMARAAGLSEIFPFEIIGVLNHASKVKCLFFSGRNKRTWSWGSFGLPQWWARFMSRKTKVYV